LAGGAATVSAAASVVDGGSVGSGALAATSVAPLVEAATSPSARAPTASPDVALLTPAADAQRLKQLCVTPCRFAAAITPIAGTSATAASRSAAVYTRRFVPIVASNPLATTLRPSGVPVPIADGQMMVNDT
jgi:hypothetical protein